MLSRSRFLLLLLSWTTLFAWACAGEDSSQSAESRVAPPVTDVAPEGAVVVRIEGQLSASSLAVVSRGIREAQDTGRDVLVVDLETPGGDVNTMRSLGNLIRPESGHGLRTVTWVHDRASSAGVLIALASEKVYVTPYSHIGAATPVTVGPQGIAEVPEEGGVRAKVMSDMLAQFRAWAEQRGRPPAIAEAMIDNQLSVLEVRVDGEIQFVSRLEWSDLREQNAGGQLIRTLSREGDLLTLTGPEAVETGFADGLAESLDIVLEKSGAGQREPLLIVPRSSEKLLGWLDLVGPVLIALGLALAFTEFKMPGFGLPGILSALCFGLAFAGQYLVGLADVPHLVLVTIGFALIAVELFLAPGTIWFGLVGGLCVLGGIVWSQLGPGFNFGNPLDQRFAFDSAFRLALSGAFAIVLSMFFVRLIPKLPLANRLMAVPGEESAFGDGLPDLDEAAVLARVGARGRVKTDLRPVGKVVLAGDDSLEFEARSPGAILERGTEIVVVEVLADRLVVEAAPEEASA